MSQDPIDAAFKALHQGNLIAAKDARIRQLEERLEAMRESGDSLAYCIRHSESIDPGEVMDSVRDWQEARNNA